MLREMNICEIRKLPKKFPHCAIHFTVTDFSATQILREINKRFQKFQKLQFYHF